MVFDKLLFFFNCLFFLGGLIELTERFTRQGFDFSTESLTTKKVDPGSEVVRYLSR